MKGRSAGRLCSTPARKLAASELSTGTGPDMWARMGELDAADWSPAAMALDPSYRLVWNRRNGSCHSLQQQDPLTYPSSNGSANVHVLHAWA